MKANVQISAVKKEFKNGQHAVLSLSYQRAKAALAQVVEDAAQGAEEIAVTAGAEPEEAPAPEEKSEELVRKPNNTLISQYEELKSKHPDALLLFRCGDFFSVSLERNRLNFPHSAVICVSKSSPLALATKGTQVIALALRLSKNSRC